MCFLCPFKLSKFKIRYQLKQLNKKRWIIQFILLLFISKAPCIELLLVRRSNKTTPAPRHSRSSSKSFIFNNTFYNWISRETVNDNSAA